MNQFYTITPHSVKKDTPNAVNIALEIPGDLKDKFKFKQGQYLTFKMEVNGTEERRSYSICNAPSEQSNLLEIVVKKLEGGKVSTYFNDLFDGKSPLEVMPPMGGFLANHHASNSKNYIGLAAGSGISPVLSNLKEALLQEPNSCAHLLYSNQNEENCIKKEEIEQLKLKFKDRFFVHYFYSRQSQEDSFFEGRLTPEKLDAFFSRNTHLEAKECTYFICGPSEMIKNCSDFLKKDKKIPAIQVFYEYFSAPDDENSEEMSEEFKAIPNLESMVTVIIDDDEYSFHLNSKKESILDKALKDQLPVPFACKGGVCCTCKAQVLEGEVFMEKNFALTEEEVSKGFVLSCQCHPTTNVVMLNFDV